ncbi:MAG: TorA maturation chaperone TorD [Desulforhopalus sp.]|jgi:TorA maturation chaperone TorD
MQNNSPAEHVATLYRFCAQSMQYPNGDWFNDQYRERLFLLLTTLGGGDQSLKLKEAFDNSTDLLEDLQVEYTRLFINGVPHVAAPPYGSIYVDKSLRGQYSDKILHYYNKSGYGLKVGADLPDSLIHQLEFLSFIVKEQNREGEIEFLTLFFLPWFPVFATRVKEEAQHPFYRTIISLIDFFTKEEEEYGV